MVYAPTNGNTTFECFFLSAREVFCLRIFFSLDMLDVSKAVINVNMPCNIYDKHGSFNVKILDSLHMCSGHVPNGG